MDEQHVYQHADTAPRVSTTFETHGQVGTEKFYVTWTAKASAPTVAEAVALLADADQALRARYGATE
jgi:hypothetical protein